MKHIILAFLSIFVLASCGKSDDNEQQDETKKDSTEKSVTENNTNEKDAKASPQQLIQGSWEMKDETIGKIVIVFEGDKMVSNVAEEYGSDTFVIEGDKITYKNPNVGDRKHKIISLTATEFVEETEDGLRNTWTRSKE